MTRTLIRNATLISMDPQIGNPLATDILIDGERIAAVGRNLAAADAAVVDGSHGIVTPGIVNAHIHTWEFPLRGIGADWVSSRDYHANMHQNLATRYTARDVYLAQPAGRAEPDPSRHDHHHGLVPHPEGRRDDRRGDRRAGGIGHPRGLRARHREAARHARYDALLQDPVSARGNSPPAHRAASPRTTAWSRWRWPSSARTGANTTSRCTTSGSRANTA